MNLGTTALTIGFSAMDHGCREESVARRIEYAGVLCECGEPMFSRIVTLGVGVESRRGPTCWLDECSLHRSWLAAAEQRAAARNALLTS
jgi:hypothetical protein